MPTGATRRPAPEASLGPGGGLAISDDVVWVVDQQASGEGYKASVASPARNSYELPSSPGIRHCCCLCTGEVG